MRLIAPALLCLAAASASARPDAPQLALPLDCVPGETCHIQAYVDADPTDGAVDFTCGTLSYDGHKGTDFALPSEAARAAGVDVRAAAPGVVAGIRDGMDDILYTPDRDAVIDGRDCGNGVLVRHGAGWETQYCHLEKGSVTVEPGQQVEAGTVLGRVGLSGRTQFPHLHLSVRHQGAVVDPFDVDAAPGQCGTDAPRTLWADPPAYRPGGLISLGFSGGIPDYEAIKAGTAASPALIATTPAIVLWAYAYGSRAGDRVALRILAPDGGVHFETEQVLDRAQAQLFRAGGKKVRGVLEPGTYRGEAALIRDGRTIDSRETSIEVR
ncbi:MAG: M23 family metallopeptidase [Pseudooceanicola sp.]